MSGPTPEPVSPNNPDGGSNFDEGLMRDLVTVVTGLPRSGTSLMMQILVAAGLPAFTDGKRQRDANNPMGYFEHEEIRGLAANPSVLDGAGGHAVKVIHALVEHLPPRFSYRVVWMHRDLEEVLTSQEKMVARLGNNLRSARDREVLGHVFRQQSTRVLDLLNRRLDVDLLVINHRDLLDDPMSTLRTLVEHLHLDADPERLAGVIDPTLYRERQR